LLPPSLSLAAYTLAAAGYLRAPATHHTRRVVLPLCDATAVGRLLEIHLAADLCLRALALAVFTAALGHALHFVAALVSWPLQDCLWMYGYGMDMVWI